MFVLKSTLDLVEEELSDIEDKLLFKTIAYNNLQNKWNDLVDLINEKGGKPFLDSGATDNRFSKKELKDMLVLCHPDKHSSSERALKTTQRINALLQEKK